jgi:type I restriction enzyme S subunit
MPNLNTGILRALPVRLPPLSEQRRIADVLDRAEALRAKRRAALAELDGLAQSIFIEMFGPPTRIMSSWPTQSLGTLLRFLTSGSRGWAEYYSETGDLFLRIQNVKNDELSLNEVAFVKPPDTAEANRTKVNAGDVLLSITADIGRTAVVPNAIEKAFISQHLALLRTDGISPRFLSAYLSSESGQEQIFKRNKQGVKAGLNFDDIRSFIIPLPPNNLQQEFARRVAVVEKLKAVQRASLAELDALFASLQDRAFRGAL